MLFELEFTLSVTVLGKCLVHTYTNQALDPQHHKSYQCHI